MTSSIFVAAIASLALLQVGYASVLPTTNWAAPSSADDTETLLVSVGGSNGKAVVADVAIYSLTTNSQKDNGAPTPSPLELFGSAIFNDTIYIVDGMNSNKDAQNSFWSYNVVKNMWISNLPSTPAATIGAQAVELGGRIYVLGGSTDVKNPTFNKQVFTYSTRLRRWYISETEIPQVDANPCAVVQEKQLFYMPAGALYFSDNGAEDWDTLASPSTNRTGASCVAVGGDSILLVGGQDGMMNYLNSVEIYNITSNQWKAVSPLSTPRSSAWAVVVPNGPNGSNSALVCGGLKGDNDVQQSCEIYDAQNDKWTNAPFALDQPRSDFGLFVLPPVQ